MLNTAQKSAATSATPPVMPLSPAKAAAGATGQPAAGTATGAKAAGAAEGGGKSKVDEAQDRFLKLLVTQMKNQDPLNPMDNAQVTSQMAQLSTVSGIEKLNSTLSALSSNMNASQSMQAAAMIGHVVVVPGNRIELKGGKGAAALDLAQPADKVTVHVKDASGNVVRTMDMGSQPAGVVQVQWDGKNDAGSALPDGEFRFSAAAQLGTDKTDAKTLTYGLVSGVAQKAGGGSSLKVDKVGEVGLDAVKQIM